MTQEIKPKLKRLQLLITQDQFEWLRKESFVKRKPMTTIFREMLQVMMYPAQKEGTHVTKPVEAQKD